MSHQDSADRRISFSNLEAIFEFLLPVELDQARRHGNASIPLRALAAMAIVCWGWSARRTLRQRMEEAAEVVARLFPDARTASRQGVLQALKTCGETIRQAILQQLQRETPGLKGYWTTAGRPTFAVDGTKFAAPRTTSNQAQFAAAAAGKRSRKKKARKQKYKSAADAAKAMTVQVLATVFWHLGSGLPACWKLDPSSGSERQAAIDLLSQLPPKSRIVADAEYVGRPFWSAILDSGHSFVIRVGSNVKLLRKLDPALKHDIEQVYHWPKRAQSRGLSPLMLRLVAVITSRGWIYLLTNEWDLTNRQVADLYEARWGIEVFFRTVKQNCGKAKLLCRTPANVQTELNWTLLAMWASLFAAKWNLHADGISLRRLSPTKVLDLLNEALRAILAGMPEAVQLVFTTCLKADESGRETGKQSRNYPRKKKPPSCGPPKTEDATEKEIALAKRWL